MAAVLTWEPLRQRLDWLQFQARAERTLAIFLASRNWGKIVPNYSIRGSRN